MINISPTIFAFLLLFITAIQHANASNPYLPERPYPSVGYRQTTIPINFDRQGLTFYNGITELPVSVWYPSDADPNDPDNTLQPANIRIDLRLASVLLPIMSAYGASVDAVYENLPIATDGGLPVVIFSHGSNSIAFQNVYLYNTLAHHGFVVVAIDHLGNSALDASRFFGQFPESILDIDTNRIGDVLNTLDEVESLFPAGTVDVSQSSIVGHSTGGLTTLQVGLKSDPRVKALVAMAPLYVSTFLAPGLDQLDLPFLLMSANLDEVLPPSANSEIVWDELSTRLDPPTTFQVQFEGAAHNSFTDLCYFQSALEDAANDSRNGFLLRQALELILPLLGEQADRPCKEAGIVDFEVVNDITAMYTTSFLKVELGLDDERGTYVSYLSRAYAESNGFGLVLEDTSLGSPAPSSLTEAPTLMPSSSPTVSTPSPSLISEDLSGVPSSSLTLSPEVSSAGTNIGIDGDSIDSSVNGSKSSSAVVASDYPLSVLGMTVLMFCAWI